MISDFIQSGSVPAALFQKYNGKLPAELLGIWREYGFGSFYHGYLQVIDPEEYTGLLERSFFLGGVSIPVFATAFGDLIVWEKNRFLGIVNYRYGTSDVISAGFDYFIQDVTGGELDEEYFSMEQYHAAVKQHGPLAYGECFGFVPLLVLGGTESADHLKKVRLREHLALIAQIGEIR